MARKNLESEWCGCFTVWNCVWENKFFALPFQNPSVAMSDSALICAKSPYSGSGERISVEWKWKITAKLSNSILCDDFRRKLLSKSKKFFKKNVKKTQNNIKS